MKFSVQENLVPGRGMAEKLSILEELGYEGIELWGTQELGQQLNAYKELLGSHRVKVSTICSGYRGDLLSASRAERDTAVADIKDRLKWASELGAVGVIVVPTFGASKIPDLSPYSSAFELERELLIVELKELSKSALDLGVSVLLEPLNRYETHFLKRLEDAYRIALEAGEGVAVMADFFHMNIEEADMASAIKSAFPRLLHVHLADSNRVRPGAGHTDFKPAFKVLREMGYDHYGALECSLAGEPKRELAEALAYLRSLRRFWSESSGSFLLRRSMCNAPRSSL
ncbi:MAG: sugar phosphate isomerase/epimerase [Candidatus Marsarchaeota archaeon]